MQSVWAHGSAPLQAQIKIKWGFSGPGGKNRSGDLLPRNGLYPLPKESVPGILCVFRQAIDMSKRYPNDPERFIWFALDGMGSERSMIEWGVPLAL